MPKTARVQYLSPTPHIRVLGIDPGLATVGLGMVHATSAFDMTALEWLTVETAAGLSLGERLREIHEDLTAYIQEQKPDLAVVEKLFFATNQQTAFSVAQARGVILLTLAEASLQVIEPTPLQLKHAIAGSGSADKKQVQDMVVRALKLDRIPTPDDAADALGLAMYGVITGQGQGIGLGMKIQSTQSIDHASKEKT